MEDSLQCSIVGKVMFDEGDALPNQDLGRIKRVGSLGALPHDRIELIKPFPGVRTAPIPVQPINRLAPCSVVAALVLIDSRIDTNNSQTQFGILILLI